MNVSPRIRRLLADHRALQRLQAESSILRFRRQGNPPERYRIRFYGRGLSVVPGTRRVRILKRHEVRVDLGASYPRTMPELAWRTPVFHPNISRSGLVCLGGYSVQWVPSFKLDELCEMLWDMIRLQNFDVVHPYNREAAEWMRRQPPERFPVDLRSLRDQATAPQQTGANSIRALLTDQAEAANAPSGSAAGSAGRPGEPGCEGSLKNIRDAEIRFLDSNGV